MVTKKKSSSNSPSKKAAPTSNSIGTYVSLRDLAKRCGLSQHAARVRLNKARVKRPGTRWRFTVGSTQLAKALKVLQETYFD
jgi:hypothetical protein